MKRLIFLLAILMIAPPVWGQCKHWSSLRTPMGSFSYCSDYRTMGVGVPAAGGCAALADVGKIYIRLDAQAPNASHYTCSQTGAGVYQWELPGGNVGAGTVTNTGGNLTADQPMFGAGLADSKVGTKSGNTNNLATSTVGNKTTGNMPQWDVNDNLTDGMPVVTSVGSPGVDTNLVTEKAIRDAIAALSATYAPIAKGVTNGDVHNHSGGDGAQISYSTLADTPLLGTAANANLGLGVGEVPVTGQYAPTAKGVTNGDTHDHSGGDGNQIAYGTLSGTPTLSGNTTEVVTQSGAKTQNAITVYDANGNIVASGCHITAGVLGCGDGTTQSAVILPELTANGTNDFRIYGAANMAADGCIIVDGQPADNQILRATATTAVIDTKTCRVMAWEDMPSGTGDVSSDVDTFAAGDMVVYKDNTGDLIGKPTLTGIPKLTSGALGQAGATDLNAPLFCADSGASDTYACNLSPAIASYVTGTRYRFKANTANTGAASINFNAVGALTIKKMSGAITTDLADNDIRAGQWVECVYDGTNCQMVSQLGNAGSGNPAYNLGAVYAIGDPGATETVDPANGAVQTMTLSANLTISFTQPVGYVGTVKLGITQGASAWTVTWTSVKWPSGIAPVQTGTASAIDWYSCLLDGTNTYCTAGQDFK